MLSVRNMTSLKSLQPIANQFIIETLTDQYFQSYKTVVAVSPKYVVGEVLLSDKWDCSRTTAKYTAQFLGCNSTKEVRKRIASGEYTVVPYPLTIFVSNSKPRARYYNEESTPIQD